MGRRIIISEEEKNQIRNLYEQSYENLSGLISDTLRTAMNNDIDLKQTATSDEYRVKWEDIGVNPENLPNDIKSNYPEFVPELLSGVNNVNDFNFNVKLLDVVKLIEDKSGLDILVTAGNDKYHQELKNNSSHNKGQALDFVLKDNNDENQQKIESVVLSIAQNEFKNLSFINEYKKDTGGSGGHFHISLSPGLNYYHFFDEGLRKNGDETYGCCEKMKSLTFNGDGNKIDELKKQGFRKEERGGYHKISKMTPIPIDPKQIKY